MPYIYVSHRKLIPALLLVVSAMSMFQYWSVRNYYSTKKCVRAVKYGAAAMPFVRTIFLIGKLVRTAQYGEARLGGALFALRSQLEN